MKLLLISVKSETAAGGIAVWTERFLEKTKQLNISCSLVNTELTPKRLRTGQRSLWGELLRTLRIYRRLRRLVKEESFDAAYLNTSCGSFGLFRDYLVARYIHKKKIPVLTQYHCEIPYWVRSRLRIDCLGRLVALSRKNLVLCQKSQEFLKKQYGQDSVKIPNFVPESVVRQTPKPISQKVRNICFVGRVSEKKGVVEIYRVAEQLPDITFRLLGEVNGQVAQWDRPENVQLLGKLTNAQVLEQLDEADLFLFPSHTEGCSMALMEAMARGVPAIATDTGANKEMLKDGCGIVVEKKDVAAMVAAIRTLDAPEKRRAMSVCAVERIKLFYTDENVDRIIAQARQVCSGIN